MAQRNLVSEFSFIELVNKLCIYSTVELTMSAIPNIFQSTYTVYI